MMCSNRTLFRKRSRPLSSVLVFLPRRQAWTSAPLVVKMGVKICVPVKTADNQFLTTRCQARLNFCRILRFHFCGDSRQAWWSHRGLKMSTWIARPQINLSPRRICNPASSKSSVQASDKILQLHHKLKNPLPVLPCSKKCNRSSQRSLIRLNKRPKTHLLSSWKRRSLRRTRLLMPESRRSWRSRNCTMVRVTNRR